MAVWKFNCLRCLLSPEWKRTDEQSRSELIGQTVKLFAAINTASVQAVVMTSSPEKRSPTL